MVDVSTRRQLALDYAEKLRRLQLEQLRTQQQLARCALPGPLAHAPHGSCTPARSSDLLRQADMLCHRRAHGVGDCRTKLRLLHKARRTASAAAAAARPPHAAAPRPSSAAAAADPPRGQPAARKRRPDPPRPLSAPRAAARPATDLPSPGSRTRGHANGAAANASAGGGAAAQEEAVAALKGLVLQLSQRIRLLQAETERERAQLLAAGAAQLHPSDAGLQPPDARHGGWTEVTAPPPPPHEPLWQPRAFAPPGASAGGALGGGEGGPQGVFGAGPGLWEGQAAAEEEAAQEEEEEEEGGWGQAGPGTGSAGDVGGARASAGGGGAASAAGAESPDRLMAMKKPRLTREEERQEVRAVSEPFPRLLLRRHRQP